MEKILTDYGLAGLLMLAISYLYREQNSRTALIIDRFTSALDKSEEKFSAMLLQQRHDFAAILKDDRDSHLEMMKIIREMHNLQTGGLGHVDDV